MFSVDFMAWVNDANLYPILSGERVRPDDPDSAAERDGFDKDYNVLWNGLIRCLDRRIKARFLRNGDTAQQLWDRIAASSQSSHEVNIDLQEDKVRGNKLSAGQTVPEWINSFVSDMNDFIAMGGVLSEVQQWKTLFDNAGPRYSE